MSFTPQKAIRRSPLPILLTILGILAVAFGIYTNVMNQRTELVAIWSRDVPAGVQITLEDLGTIAVPINRVPQLDGVSNPEILVGTWSTRNVGKDELATMAQVSMVPPTRPMYPNGKALPQGMVPLPFSTTTVGPLTDRDYLNIGFTDPTGDQDRCREVGGTPTNGDVTEVLTEGSIPEGASVLPASASNVSANGEPIPYTCMLMTKLEVLYVDGTKGAAFLAGTLYQSQALWTVSAIPGVSLFGQRYSGDSEMAPVIGRMEPQDLNAFGLSGAYSETNKLLPGVRTTLPGAPDTLDTTGKTK
ncbi:SAF domain-containing protein [Herpetosiphon geysericola]|uniref:SAF domain-containing protein n=1 Tax=Herpetosiphon geysericola TaxID=70996 RepID=A0A0N8GP57_9CHLR|nr:SAF domain-containing protein [Herpetosiphon geysericola]KPL79970.1 hypothetical protein SE18_25615 [Herpetosiphon geysericola]